MLFFPARRSSRLLYSVAVVLVAMMGSGSAQETEATPAPQTINVEALSVDIEALTIASQATTRCAVFNSDIVYLTPLEQAAVEVHLSELETVLENAVENSAERLAAMKATAAGIDCGDADLVDYMDFGRQIGRDVIDTAMLAWREIEISRCNYFADSDFMDAVGRAQDAGAAAQIDGAANRVAFLEQRAETWVQLFGSNCSNLYFDPVTTLPGQIALALPTG